MKLEEYLELTKRTLPDLGSKELNIAHMLYGMISEMNEIYDAVDKVNLSEEYTDIFWYFANYCNLNNIRISDHISLSSSYLFRKEKHYDKKLVYCLSKLANYEKRELAYKKPFLDDIKLEVVIDIAKALNDCYVSSDLNVFSAMEKNINKLKVRYPEKFNEVSALNRDLEQERKTLEN